LKSNKKIYFASDLHLGIPNEMASRERELKFISWLDEVRIDAGEIHLMGDLFDFWFEYKRAIPRGYIRLLGKLAEIADAGIPLYWYLGNHDMWIFDYLPKEIGLSIIPNESIREFNGKKFFLHHGDGLGPGDNGYKFLKKIFRSRLCQWMFARLHPNFGIWLADKSSRSSRYSEPEHKKPYQGDEKEFLVQFCHQKLEDEHFDYLIFGHRHLPIDMKIKEGRYINLGDWLEHFSYAVFDGNDVELKYWK